MLNKTQIFSLCVPMFFLLSSCGESSITITDPFKTSKMAQMDDATQQLYQKRIIETEQSSAIIADIKTEQEKAKQQDNGFEFKSIQYNPKTKTVDITDLKISQAISEDFENKKNVQISWYDSKNDIPHYMAATVVDSLIPKPDFLATLDGQEYQTFFKKLNADGQNLINRADLAYDYNEQNGEIRFAISDDFHQLINIRMVIKADGLSKATLDMLKSSADAAPDPSMFLGMLSGIRIQEIYLKMKMERTAEEVINALPEEEAKTARDEFQASKTNSEKEIQKMAGKTFTLEQLQSYRQSWFNFLENKQPLVISIHPDVPQPLPTFFTAMMMAENNPKVLANLFKQINLKVSNQDI